MKSINFVLIILLLTSVASATEYMVKFETSLKTGSWSGTTYTINKSQSVNVPGGMTFTYYSFDPGSTPQKVWFKFSPTTNSNEDLIVGINDPVCFRYQGNNANLCKNDPDNATDGTVRFTLKEITAISGTTSSGINTSEDDPISATIHFDDDDITLSKTKTKTFDVPKEVTKRDLDPEDIPEITINFKSGIPFDVSLKIETDNKNMDEPESKWVNSNHMKYIIEDAAKYTFSVKYSYRNPSGMSTDRTETYMVDLKGITGKTSSQSAPLSSNTNEYTVYLPDTIKISMSKEGTFEPLTDVIITPNGGNAFTFKFPSPGTYTAVYKSGSETAEVRFIARTGTSSTEESPNTESTPTTITGQQSQGLGDSNTIILMLVGAVLVGGFLWMKKKGGKGGQKFDLHANRNG